VIVKAPCKVYYERKDGSKKVITANTELELKSLLRIGWKLEEPQEQ
jgi:hypothetical protein